MIKIDLEDSCLLPEEQNAPIGLTTVHREQNFISSTPDPSPISQSEPHYSTEIYGQWNSGVQGVANTYNETVNAQKNKAAQVVCDVLVDYFSGSMLSTPQHLAIISASAKVLEHLAKDGFTPKHDLLAECQRRRHHHQQLPLFKEKQRQQQPQQPQQHQQQQDQLSVLPYLLEQENARHFHNQDDMFRDAVQQLNFSSHQQPVSSVSVPYIHDAQLQANAPYNSSPSDMSATATQQPKTTSAEMIYQLAYSFAQQQQNQKQQVYLLQQLHNCEQLLRQHQEQAKQQQKKPEVIDTNQDDTSIPKIISSCNDLVYKPLYTNEGSRATALHLSPDDIIDTSVNPVSHPSYTSAGNTLLDPVITRTTPTLIHATAENAAMGTSQHIFDQNKQHTSMLQANPSASPLATQMNHALSTQFGTEPNPCLIATQLDPLSSSSSFSPLNSNPVSLSRDKSDFFPQTELSAISEHSLVSGGKFCSNPAKSLNDPTSIGKQRDNTVSLFQAEHDQAAVLLTRPETSPAEYHCDIRKNLNIVRHNSTTRSSSASSGGPVSRRHSFQQDQASQLVQQQQQQQQQHPLFQYGATQPMSVPPATHYIPLIKRAKCEDEDRIPQGGTLLANNDNPGMDTYSHLADGLINSILSASATAAAKSSGATRPQCPICRGPGRDSPTQ